MVTTEEELALKDMCLRGKKQEILDNRGGNLSKAMKISRMPHARRVEFGEEVMKATHDGWDYSTRVRMVFDRDDETMCGAVLMVCRGLI